MRFVFGPVKSRRLGNSLGIDLLPYKTCSLDCVYCECGDTTTFSVVRKSFALRKEIQSEIDSVLQKKPQLDFVTFSGSGEPTLSSDIGKIIDWMKKKYPEYKVAVLTHGTLLWMPDVRSDLAKADLVKVSVDAGSAEVYEKVNRPCGGLSFEKVVEGMVSFSKGFEGDLWLEIFVVPGVNDSADEAAKIGDIVRKLDPDRIQINHLDRPGTERWVEKPSPGELESFRERLGVSGAEIIGEAPKARVMEKDAECEGMISRLLSKESMSLSELVKETGFRATRLRRSLGRLSWEGKILGPEEKTRRFRFIR